ncbi:autotransporter domain-containing protein [Parvibaculum sp.]|jgi:hypothetical protein|uniref:autotransporter domain-containing protein n=1 Tax=Parvibaculum sp. TaxID=2024848 RepID=UPI000C3746F0|nr:autotransporter domain-containing protein [Parvibaculum sp.]MAM93025.1 hypothetical protein [Parvibaculum sp.]|tara:strand:+ start:3921 stop:9626 length:5706 start_codon:yes stop_codon:yes gene_type:complete
MTKQNNAKAISGAKTGRSREARLNPASAHERNLLGSAYSYYSGVVRTSGQPSTASGVRRLFAAALLSGASMVAVGLGGTGQARAEGACLPQAGEGEQILCIGTFDETIDIDVEDVTVVLGEGSIVDTRDNASESYGDNTGIVVFGPGDQTVRNDGTVLTGEEYSYEYSEGNHHGIVAYAEEGYDAHAVNSATGIIGTTSEDSYGVFARSFGEYWDYSDATAVNDGSVSTTGEGSFGVIADGKYADAINTGLVFTEGSDAAGIYAYSKYESYAYNSGEIETDGSESDGIRAYSEEGDAEVVNAEGGIVTTSGEGANGVDVWAEGYADVTNAGSIVTYGEYAVGVATGGYSVTVNNSGSIRTYGDEANAVSAHSGGFFTTTIVNTGFIGAYGEDSDAINASGPTVRITNNVVVEDDEVVATGLIHAEDGFAIHVEETDDARVYNYATIDGAVELSTDEYAYVRNDGLISSEDSGTPVIEAYAAEGDAVVIIGGDGVVRTRAEYSTGVYAGGDSAIVKNYGSVTTGYSEEGNFYGDYSAGIRARGEEEGALALSTGSVTTFGDYAEALSASTEYGTAQAVNTGDIDTYGTLSAGVIAMDYNTYGYDEYSEYSGAGAGNAGDVETRGYASVGVGAFSVENSATAYNVLGGTISTSGDGAHGLAAGTGFDSVVDAASVTEGNGRGGSAFAVNGSPFGFYGPVSLDVEYDEGPRVSIIDYVDTEYFEPADYRSTIVTSGDNSIGVAAISSGGSAWAGNFYGSITTGTLDEYDDPDTGEGSHGLVAYSDLDEAVAMNKYHGEIVTRGNDAYGIWATSDDDMAHASNKYASSIITHGDGSIGMRVIASGEYGAYGDGYDADAFNISSSITTYGDYAAGVSVISYEGDVVAVNASGSIYEDYDLDLPEAAITTHGDYADGIEARAEYGTVYAYNNGTITTYGESSTGIAVSGQTVEVHNYGNIYTSGEYAHGIIAYSESPDTTTVVNGGVIEATGEETNGIRAFGPTVNVTNLEDGDIYAEDDALYIAEAEVVTVTNHGTIGSYGSDGIDIQYAEAATVTNHGDMNSNEAGIEVTTTDEVSIYNYGSVEGRVDVSGAYDAYFLNDEGAEVIVSEESSDEDGGVRIEAFAEVDVVNRGSITVAADETYGVYLRSNTVSLDNSGTIATSGEYSHALVARSEALATTTITNSGTIEAPGEYADAIVASGPTVNITNTGDGVISSASGAAIYANETKYVDIVNDGEITGDVLIAAYGVYEYSATVEIDHTGSVDGNVDTSFGYSDDTILIDGGTVSGAVHTGDGIDEVTVSGSGVQLGLGIHATESGIAPLAIRDNSAYLTFAHDDTITLDDGIGGWGVSHFDTVNIDSGKLVLDGVGIHTSYSEGSVTVAEGATLGVTGQGADIAADNVSISGTLDLALDGFLDATGTVAFNEGSTFRADISSGGAAVVYGDTVSFSEGSTIDVDVIGGLSGVVGDDILIASADSENGVTDNGASVEDNTILFDFLKVMDDEVIETGSADDLFLRIQLAETAEETEVGVDGRVNLVGVAKAIDEYIATQPIDSPLTLWLAQFETEEEQRAALLKVVQDSMPSESNAEGTSTMASTDLIFDMIMDRISGGGFAIANNTGDTGLAAGDQMLGGDGKWAIWGRVGGLKAEYTPSGVNGFDTDMWGATGGVDGEVAANIRLGLSAFYSSADIDENGAGANSISTVDSYGAVAYMSYRPGAWYVNGSLGYGFNNYESSRSSLGGVNVADYDGSQFVARAEAGRMFTSGAFDITPNVGLRYNLVDVDAYTETGPLPTSVNGRTIESLRAVGGVNFRYTAELDGGSKLIPELGVKVLSELADPDEAITGSVVGGGAFTTQQTARDDVSYGVLGGLTFEGVNGVTLRVTYDGEFQSDYEEQSLSAAIRIAF